MSRPNVIKHEGTTLFRDTIVGYVDDTENLLTVGILSMQWKAARQLATDRIAELCDALRVLLDEVIEERGRNMGQPLDRAIQLGLNALAGKEPEPAPEPSPDASEFGPVAAKPGADWGRRKTDTGEKPLLVSPENNPLTAATRSGFAAGQHDFKFKTNSVHNFPEAGGLAMAWLRGYENGYNEAQRGNK